MKVKVNYNSIEINGIEYATPLSETERPKLPRGWRYFFDSDLGRRNFVYKGRRKGVDNDQLQNGPVVLDW